MQFHFSNSEILPRSDLALAGFAKTGEAALDKIRGDDAAGARKFSGQEPVCLKSTTTSFCV
jgi:hypothetical protein